MIRIFLISLFLFFTLLCKSNASNQNSGISDLKSIEFKETALKNNNQGDLIDSGPFVGAVTEISATFIVKPVNQSNVKFELSEDSLFSGSFYSEETGSDENKFNFTKIEINNLKPDTKYFYRAVLDNITTDRVHSFRTFPSEKNINFSFGFGSCQQGYNSGIPAIFPVIAKDSLRFFLQTGDWTYPDFGNPGKGYNKSMELLAETYRKRYDYSYPFNSEVLSKMPVSYLYDDHDFAGNDADGTNEYKLNSVKAYDMFFPHYKMDNPDNGIWQKFRFGDVEFFMLDLRTQRSANLNSVNSQGVFDPQPGHSILSGFDIEGENQKSWLENSLKNSDAKWKVIISPVIFNPKYMDALNDQKISQLSPKIQKGIVDKWAGFPEDIEFLKNLIKDNSIENVIMVSGDSHSSYIDDGENSFIPEISSSNLDTKNSKIGFLIQMAGYNIWNQGSYNDDGHAYGRISFFFGKEEYAKLEVVDQKGAVVLSYKLNLK